MQLVPKFFGLLLGGIIVGVQNLLVVVGLSPKRVLEVVVWWLVQETPIISWESSTSKYQNCLLVDC